MSKILKILFVVWFCCMNIQAARSVQSYFKLTTSNGQISAVYDQSTNEITAVFPHIFTFYDSAQVVKPFVGLIRLQTRFKPLKTFYNSNSHVIEVDYKPFRVFYFASFNQSNKIFYIVVRGKKSDICKLQFRYKEMYCKVYKYDFVKNYGKYTEKYFLFSFDDQSCKNGPAIAKARAEVFKNSGSLVNQEIMFMKNLFKKCKYPSRLNADEKNTFEQSITVLKMSQVNDNEVFKKSRGQILASLKPGEWAIAWVRDGAYTIEAMSRIGMFLEAKKGLEFMLNASPSGQYVKFIHTDGKDYGIGVDYQISVTRYYGNGREEADYSGADSPNIELDDFGLFLIAFYKYVHYSGDMAFVEKWHDVLTKKIADPILHNIAENGLIRADSGPWEHHLPGNQYAFTTAVCARGLELLNELLKSSGKGEDLYTAKANEMKQAIMDKLLFEGRMFKGNVRVTKPTDARFYDGATYEMFANKLFTDSILVYKHFEGFESKMRVNSERGYIRIAGDDPYENQEWPFLSLRIASIHTYFHKMKDAKLIIDWNTNQAKCNYNLFPEIYGLGVNDNVSLGQVISDNSRVKVFAKYAGSIPMVGYGSATYIIAVSDYYGLK